MKLTTSQVDAILDFSPDVEVKTEDGEAVMIALYRGRHILSATRRGPNEWIVQFHGNRWTIPAYLPTPTDGRSNPPMGLPG